MPRNGGVVFVCSGVSQTAFKGCIKDVQLGTLAKDLSENIEFKDVAPGCTEVCDVIMTSLLVSVA